MLKKLWDIDILLDKGKTVGEACWQFEITEQAYYRWRQKYAGMTSEMVTQLNKIEKENTRLCKIIADQRIDIPNEANAAWLTRFRARRATRNGECI